MLGVWTARRRPQAAEPHGLAASRLPTSWRMANESLVVFDATGAPSSSIGFGFPVEKSVSSESCHPDIGPPSVVMADLDGDGPTEVLVRTHAVDRANSRLYCFEADGRLRFTRQPAASRRFGADDYSEPWLPHEVIVTRRANGLRGAGRAGGGSHLPHAGTRRGRARGRDLPVRRREGRRFVDLPKVRVTH